MSLLRRSVAALCVAVLLHLPVTAQGQESVSPEAAADAEAEEVGDEFFDDDLDLLFGDDTDDAIAGFPDPWEGFNRSILTFNNGVTRWVLRPVALGFDFIMPDPLKFGLRRMFENLDTPVVFANDLLQLEWTDAGVTLGAFVVNSTVGLAGFFEPAARMGWERHHSDFGQTLALAGTPSGPYLMLPVVGPTTIRDGGGSLGNMAMRPTTWFFGLGVTVYLYTGLDAVVDIEQNYRNLQELQKSSVDFYRVLRSAYYQNRTAQIWQRREDRRDDAD